MHLAFIVIGILLGAAGCSSSGPAPSPDSGGTGGNAGHGGGTGLGGRAGGGGTSGNAGHGGGTGLGGRVGGGGTGGVSGGGAGGVSGGGAGGVSGGGAGGVSGGGAGGLGGRAGGGGIGGGGTGGVSSGAAGSVSSGGAGGFAGGGTAGAPLLPEDLISDFEDPATATVAKVGTPPRSGRWQAYNDGSSTCIQQPAAGAPYAPAVPPTLPPGTTGSRALHVAFAGCAMWGAGVGADLLVPEPTDGAIYDGPKIRYDLSGQTGLVFWAMATPGKDPHLRVRVNTSDVVGLVEGGDCDEATVGLNKCGDAYGQTFTLPTNGSWAKITVAFADRSKFKQEGWGQTFPWNPGHVVSIQFQSTELYEPYDFWIDDIYLTRAVGGGAGGGAGGTAGAAGAAGMGGLPAPPGQLITDFSGGPSLVGSPYVGAGQGWATPAVSTSSGALHVTLSSGASTAIYSHAYVGLPLTNPPFKAPGGAAGVSFTISGTLTGPGCQLQYSTVDQDHASTAMNGHCTGGDGCYPSSKVFTLPPTPTKVTVRWADQTGGFGIGGASAFANASQIVGLEWRILTSSGAIGSSCVADVVIDDISLAD